ncbi:MAG: peptidoglycan DD-metalloendopeptidase family protein [Woeseiaceae bacterium]|nr:peptidoglycan DD-metalloendopeptidase family protein [Woeseiaceae bacterium]
MTAWRQIGRYCSLLAVFAMPALTGADTLYKYRDPDGTWVYTDRKPDTSDGVEVRELPGGGGQGQVTLSRHTANGRLTVLASNSLHAPVQLRLLGRDVAPRREPADWVLAPQSTTELMSFEVGTPAAAAGTAYRYQWLFGDPEATHRPPEPYRAPFPAAVTHRVSQAWPELRTHTTVDSGHAVDIVMPVGSNVHAARGGVVVEVAATNFSNSDKPDGEGATANLVRILHDDGTFAVYAHLDWNSIRVRAGEPVERGQYIANSGNTGFSTGPHLHFVVLHNVGMRIQSIPVQFAGAGDTVVVPSAGDELTAY